MIEQSVFASASSSSVDALREGDLTSVLQQKRTAIKKISDKLYDIARIEEDKRPENWYEEVALDLSKLQKLTIGRLGQLQDLQQPYYNWLEATLHLMVSETFLPIVEDAKVQLKSTQHLEELKEKIRHLETDLNQELDKLLNAPLQALKFARPKNSEALRDHLMAYLVERVHSKDLVCLDPFGVIAFDLEVTPYAKQDKKLKQILQVMAVDLEHIKQIQYEFEKVYATLGSKKFNVHHLSSVVKKHLPCVMAIQNHYIEEKNYKSDAFEQVKQELLRHASKKVEATAALKTVVTFGERCEPETSVPLGEMLMRNYTLSTWSNHILGGVEMVSETLVDQNKLCPAGAGGRFFKDSLHFTVLLLEDFLA